MGRAREWDVGHRVRRIRTLARDPIESGRQIHAAVDADTVRPQGIDGDEDKVTGCERWLRLR